MDCVITNSRNPKDVVVTLKLKVIDEYMQLLDKLNVGYKYAYDDILDKINLIDLMQKGNSFSPFITQYYLNKTWVFRQY